MNWGTVGFENPTLANVIYAHPSVNPASLLDPLSLAWSVGRSTFGMDSMEMTRRCQTICNGETDGLKLTERPRRNGCSDVMITVS